jgi:hypothetical protein
VGGPIRIPKVYHGQNRSFFFFNFEQFRETRTVSSGITTVPRRPIGTAILPHPYRSMIGVVYAPVVFGYIPECRSASAGIGGACLT